MCECLKRATCCAFLVFYLLNVLLKFMATPKCSVQYFIRFLFGTWMEQRCGERGKTILRAFKLSQSFFLLRFLKFTNCFFCYRFNFSFILIFLFLFDQVDKINCGGYFACAFFFNFYTFHLI